MSSIVALSSLLAACSSPSADLRTGSPADPQAPAPPAPPPALEGAPPESERLPVDARVLEATATPPAEARRAAITLDRPLYRPGDTVWGRVWDLTGAELAAGAAAPGVTVSMVDPKGTTVASHRLQNTGAGTPFDLRLPAGASGGLYQLRAQVDRGPTVTRPFVVAAFEEPRIRKELELLRDAYAPGDEVTASLTVASAGRGPLMDHRVQILVQLDGVALDPLEVVTDALGEATVRFTLPPDVRSTDAVLTAIVEEDGWTESVSREIPVALEGLRAELFPEGGRLVVGLPGRVYVRVRDASGQPADASGVVVDDKGVELGSFRTLHDGLARFELTPRRGRTYAVHLSGSAPAPLPAAQPEGCVLKTYDDPDTEVAAIRAGVWCSEPRRVVVTGGLRGRRLAPVSVWAGPQEPAVAHLLPEDPRDARLQGVATVSLWAEDLTPLAERLVFRNRSQDLDVTLEPTRTRFGPRDEVELRVTARDPSGEPVAADLALAVVDDRLVKYADDRHGTLVSQLLLSPHLQGSVEDPGWYFDADHPDAGQGLDLVLGTYGWRRFQEVDEGRGAKARKEEGKVGKREARAVPDGVLQPSVAAPEQRAAGGVEELAGGIGGLLGASGTQLGAGGLGGRGVGLGGGGLAEGLGGLGTRGMGSGASGYGRGGGEFGAKGEGGIGTVGGDPIILGAMDRDVIDAIVKRHLNQIKYCYQRELTRRPDLGGKVVIKFAIAKDGRVSAASVKRTTLASPPVESCMVGRFLRMQFPQPTGGGIVIVSYPFVFAPSGEFAGVPGPGAPPEFHPVREFAQPDYGGKPAPEVRTDFRSTVAWLPSVHTGADGTATVKFFLADSVTTWRVTAEGVGAGHVGRAEQELHSTLPFSLDVPLPTEVSFGDRLAMPVRLSSRRDEATDVALTTTIEAPLVADDGTGLQHLSLGAGDGAVTVVPIEVPDLVGTAKVKVSATSAGLTDSIERTLRIAPRGFPHEWQAGGSVAERAVHRVVIDDALPGGTSGKVVLYPSPVSSLMEGVGSLVRMPGGCFEQTSSTNHPNVLVLEYLDRTGGGGSLLVDRTSVLREGYRRLTSYQVPGGGFETFGNGPGKEALSAYGLLQFTRMRRVFPEVEATVTDRDVQYLLSARDGSGGFTNTGSSAHGYGAAPQPLNDAFVTRALAETGHLRSGPELERQRAEARTATDPYLLSLATLTLAAVGDAGTAAAADRLAAMQQDGSFPGAKTSIEHSSGPDLLVETTALATLALQRAGGHEEGVAAAAQWLGSQRRGTSGWGNTQATVLSLEALSAVASSQRATAGSVAVLVDGREVGTVAYTGAERGGVTLDLTRWLGVGAHELALVHRGERPIPYTFEAAWRRDAPADAPGAPLLLESTLAGDSVALGHTVRLTASVTNTSSEAVASPIARVRLPAGVRVEPRALEDLKARGRVAFFETRPREVTLYWTVMAPGERQEVGLDLVAEVPGTFTAPPSVVYPYYTSTAVDWAAGDTLRITP